MILARRLAALVLVALSSLCAGGCMTEQYLTRLCRVGETGAEYGVITAARIEAPRSGVDLATLVVTITFDECRARERRLELPARLRSLPEGKARLVDRTGLVGRDLPRGAADTLVVVTGLQRVGDPSGGRFVAVYLPSGTDGATTPAAWFDLDADDTRRRDASAAIADGVYVVGLPVLLPASIALDVAGIASIAVLAVPFAPLFLLGGGGFMQIPRC